MEVAGHRVSRVDNTWGFYRSTLSPKEKTPKDTSGMIKVYVSFCGVIRIHS